MDMSGIIGLGGIISLSLMALTILTGLCIIKLGIVWHKRLGKTTGVFALIHGTLAFLFFTYGFDFLNLIISLFTKAK